MEFGLPLMKNVLKPVAESDLMPFGVRATASATDAAIQKRSYESYITILIISNKKMVYIMKIVKSLEESGLLINSVSKTIKNEAKEQKGGFLNILLCALASINW